MNKMIEKYKKMPVQVRASLWFVICAFLQKGVSVITTPIFTRLLNAGEYGQYSVFNSWLSIVTVFVSLSLYWGVYSQGLIKFENERKEYTSSLQGLMLTLVAVWTIIYLIFHNFWNNFFSLTTVQMLAMLLMIWTTGVFNFWSMEQRVDFKYIKLVILTLIVSIAKPLVGILLVINVEDKVTARILGLAIIELLAYLGLFIGQMIRGKKFYYGKFWKYALAFNIPLIPHYLSNSILTSADRIMINDLIGSQEAGIYSLAYAISQIMTILNSAMMQTIEPWIYRKIKAKEINDISKVAYPVFVIVAISNIMIIAFGPEIINIFAPETYYDAIWVIPPVAMSVFFMYSYSFFAEFEFYYGKTKWISISTMVGAITNVALNYVCLNLWGYYAAGYTTLVCYILYAAFHFWFMNKICNENLNGEKPCKMNYLLIIVAGFIGVGFIFLLSYNSTVVRYGFITSFAIFMFMIRNRIKKIIKVLITIKKDN